MKFKLTTESIEFCGRTLFRIECVTPFGSVEIGDKGGFVEKEDNLSQFCDAKVCGNALVYGDAWVFGNAEVFGNAKVYGDAKVFGNAEVYGNAEVCGNAEVYGDAEVYGNAEVFGNAKVYGDALVYGDAKVFGDAWVCGNALVYGDAKVFGDAWVCGNAKVKDKKGYIVLKNWWSSGRYFTWTSSNDKWKVGCFFGTGAELIAKAYKDSEVSGREYERIVKYVDSIKDQFKD